MSKTGFSVYDFTVNSLRATLDNVRLMALAILTFFGGMIAAAIGACIIVSPTFLRLWHIMPSIKQATIGIDVMDKAAQAKVMAGVWQQVYPLFGALDIALCVLSILFFFTVVIGLIVGFLRVTLDIVDHGSSTVSRMLSCFKLAPRFLLASFLSLLVICAGTMLFIIPGIILTLRLRFFSYYILDKNMGAIESLKASFHDTKGFEWEILGLNVVAAVLATVAPVIGIPVSCFILAFAYRALPR